MPSKKPALGRGLDALFGSAPPPAPVMKTDAIPAAGLRHIPIAEIEANPHQPRTSFDADKLNELAASIKEKGILQPILLRKKEDHYEIVAGERRWRAAQMAGLHQVPAIIKDFDEQEMTVAAIIENIQRDDLNPIEEARGYETLASVFGLTQESIATTVGKSRVAITNAMRLLRLPKSIIQMISNNELSAGHARALLALESPDQQLSLARETIENQWNVREIEKRVRTGQKPKASANGTAKHSSAEDIPDLEEKLSMQLGLKVKIKAKTNTSGRVEVFYSSLDEFQRFCDSLGLALPQIV